MTDHKIVSKDDCGVFAILKKKHSVKISNQIAIDGIECVRFRGSKYGAGFASFNLDNSNQDFLLSIFVENEKTFEEIKTKISNKFNPDQQVDLIMPDEAGPSSLLN